MVSVNGKSIETTMACCVVADRELDYHMEVAAFRIIVSCMFSIAVTTIAENNYWNVN